jgi:hypothetical protein
LGRYQGCLGDWEDARDVWGIGKVPEKISVLADARDVSIIEQMPGMVSMIVQMTGMVAMIVQMTGMVAMIVQITGMVWVIEQMPRIISVIGNMTMLVKVIWAHDSVGLGNLGTCQGWSRS